LDRHQTFLSNLLDFNPKPEKSSLNRDFSSPFSIRAPGPRKQKGELVTSSQSFGDQLLSFLKIKNLTVFQGKIFQFANWIHMEVPFISPVKIPEDDTLPSFFAGGFYAELDEPG
jgi:hypothetical protein